MKHKKINLSALFILALGLTGLFAQESIPASGGEASGNGGTVSYSIGQVFYFTNTGENGSATHGVQQPFEISVVNGVNDKQDISLLCSAFPNPVTDFLVLKIDAIEKKDLFYQLFDSKGNLIFEEELNRNESTISMETLLPSIYLLRIVKLHKKNSEEEIKVFKIVKK